MCQCHVPVSAVAAVEGPEKVPFGREVSSTSVDSHGARHPRPTVEGRLDATVLTARRQRTGTLAGPAQVAGEEGRTRAHTPQPKQATAFTVEGR
eukprot:2531166-Prymnesium_polylepis.1